VGSPLFWRVEERETGLAALLERFEPRRESGAIAWEDDGWLVARSVSLGATEPQVVHLYGPAVVRARLLDEQSGALSRREAECLSIALEGHENTAIATRLGLRPETVKVHLRSAYRKLSSSGRSDLLARLVSP
jgi:DNA-binding CsgD family transcriptional regulator